MSLSKRIRDIEMGVSMIVGRQHVGNSDNDVVDAVKSKLSKGVYDSFDDYEKREFRSLCIAIHRDNQGLYSKVQTGFFD